MVNVVLFGELMLRLSPEGYNRFIQANNFDVHYGGSEANVAVSLSNFGISTSFVTRLPDNDLGKSAMNSLRQFGVGTDQIIFGGERIGIYFMEKGASQRPSKIIYDRKYSSISTLEVSDFNWDEIFKDADYFHFSGITPALSDNLAKICLNACKIAKDKGLIVSCDLNYRNKLWTKSKANEVMSKIIPYVDICVGNEEDISDIFGIKPENTDVTQGKLSYGSYKNVAKQVHDKFGCSIVACTLRTSMSASDNKWTSMLFDGDNFYSSEEYDMHIIDRVGGGDSFVAGLLYGLNQKMSLQESLDFATAASCLKHTIEGDFNMVTVDEVNKLALGDGSGRVQR